MVKAIRWSDNQLNDYLNKVKVEKEEEKRKSKYMNQKCESNGEKFDSKREMRRYEELLLMVKSGDIINLQRQATFELAPSVVINGRKRPPLKYIADFIYFDVKLSKVIIEDAKGKITEGYRIKRHLMAALGKEIKEV